MMVYATKAKSLRAIAGAGFNGKPRPTLTAAFIDNRSEVITGRLLSESIHNSPRTEAQAEQIRRAFGDAAQVTHKPDAGAVQRESEPQRSVHGDGAVVQRLRVEEIQPPVWRRRGEFNWQVRLVPEDNEGVGCIIQEIENVYQSSDPTGWRPRDKYWEGWPVGQGEMDEGEAKHGGRDIWFRPPKKKFSRGNWSMQGKLYFIDDPYPDGLSEGQVKDADQLISTTSEPKELGPVLATRFASGRWGPLRGHRGAAS